MVKTLQNLFLQNRQADFHETWYVASGLQPIIVCSNDEPGVTLSYFTSRSNLVRPKKCLVSGWVEGGQGRCEQRSEVFLKIQKKSFFVFFWGGGGGGLVGGGVGHEGVRMDVNEELKFLRKFKFLGGGSGWGGQGRCEQRREVFFGGVRSGGGGGGRRSEVFVKFQKKNFFLGGGGSG